MLKHVILIYLRHFDRNKCESHSHCITLPLLFCHIVAAMWVDGYEYS